MRVIGTVLLLVVGILLVTNTIWLFPDEGESEYTYERVEINIEDGQLSYDRPGLPGVGSLVSNDLNSIDCTLPPGTWRHDRLCAFDLERISPENLLSAIATDVSHIPEDDPDLDDIPLEHQIAVTGETTTTTTHLEADSVPHKVRY